MIRYYVNHQLMSSSGAPLPVCARRGAGTHPARPGQGARPRWNESIALIRRSANTDTARTGLMQMLDIDEIQATAILDMQLRRLSAWNGRRSSTSCQDRGRNRRPQGHSRKARAPARDRA